MQIIPVLDVSGGIVVRAVAGRRSDYRPLVSRLTKSTDPVDLATAMWERTAPRDSRGAKCVYVADLDSITGPRIAPDLALLDRLVHAGFNVWIDAGVREPADALLLKAAQRIIVGSETLCDTVSLREILQQFGADRVVYSLDLRDGQVLTPHPNPPPQGGREQEALQAVDDVVETRCRNMLVLDLARVGVGDGIGTEELCRSLRRRHPQLAVFIGGGISDGDDVRRLESLGVTGVLVSSAIHTGALDYQNGATERQCHRPISDHVPQ